jgi:drug/metabolite transporter (DMT)-like permease
VLKEHTNSVTSGIALKVAATLAFAVMNALIKAVSARFPVAEIVLFRSLGALVVLVMWLSSAGEFPRALATRRPFGHIGRSLAGSGGMTANFVVLALLPLADATAFTFISPLLIVPLAALTLGEIVKPYRWAAVTVGFFGVLVMLSDHLGEGPQAGAEKLGVAIALVGALCTAVAMIQTSRLAHSEATGAIVFYFTSVTTILSAAFIAAAAFWPAGAPLASYVATQNFVAPNAEEYVTLALVGALGGLGQIFMTHSYRFADASIIAAFDYVAMIWAAILGLVFFAEAPTPRILAGALIVCAAGLFVLWRERRVRGIEVDEVLAGRP